MEKLVKQLSTFHNSPGLLSLEDFIDILDFMTKKLWFIQVDILAQYGELTKVNKMGAYNSTLVFIERAEWYIKHKTTKLSE